MPAVDLPDPDLLMLARLARTVGREDVARLLEGTTFERRGLYRRDDDSQQLVHVARTDK